MVVSFKNSDSSMKSSKSNNEKRFEFKHKFNIVCCFDDNKNDTKSTINGSDSLINELTITEKSLKESNKITRKKRRLNNKSSVYRMMKYEKDDDETSSIVGFNLSNRNIELSKARSSIFTQAQINY
jgi:hypothetical protein